MKESRIQALPSTSAEHVIRFGPSSSQKTQEVLYMEEHGSRIGLSGLKQKAEGRDLQEKAKDDEDTVAPDNDDQRQSRHSRKVGSKPYIRLLF